jgi:uncharacterized membrane protein HdeD (DUF308 family)
VTVPAGSPALPRMAQAADPAEAGCMNAVTRDDGAELLPGPLQQVARSAWQVVLTIGVASIVLGIVVLSWPHATLSVVGVIFGIYLLVSGVLQLFAAFGTHAETSLRMLAFVSGAVSILLGLFCLRGALESILLLALWIGIGWLFRGIAMVVAAVSDPLMPARGWHVFAGMMGVIAGVVVLVTPEKSITVLTVLAGIWLLFMGVVETGTAIRIRAHAKQLPTGM